MEKRIKKGLLLFALVAEVVFVSIPVPVMAKEEVYLEIVDAELWDEDTSLLLQEDSEEGTVISEEGIQISAEDFLECEEKTVASSESGRRCEIKVALIDTGVDTTSALLQGHIADGYDASNMSDENGHGTLMAEIIASNTNENVKIVPYKVFDENGRATVGATYDALLKAINEKVDVISLSVSGYGTSYMLASAIAKAKEKGIYVVVAAGNDGDNADNYMPGNISDAITVSGVSVDETGTKTLAAYSNYGSVVDYSAFGTIVKDYGTEDAADDEVYEGTSVSAANVSSYIATVLQYVRDDGATDYDEVLDALNSTTEDLGEGGRDDAFGVGYLSFEEIQKYIADKAQLEEEVVENEDEIIINESDEDEENEDEIIINESDEDEEEYPDEEGDIDFDFDEEDAEQDLKTSATNIGNATALWKAIDDNSRERLGNNSTITLSGNFTVNNTKMNSVIASNNNKITFGLNRSYTIDGNGHTITISGTCALHNNVLFHLYDGADITLKNITIKVAGLSNVVAVQGVSKASDNGNRSNIKLEDVTFNNCSCIGEATSYINAKDSTFKNATTPALVFRGATGIVDNCTFSNVNEGIQTVGALSSSAAPRANNFNNISNIDGKYSVKITDCTFTNVAEHAAAIDLYAQYTSSNNDKLSSILNNVYISGCTITSNSSTNRYGIVNHSGSTLISKENSISGWTYGVQNENGGIASLSGDTIDNCSDTGFKNGGTAYFNNNSKIQNAPSAITNSGSLWVFSGVVSGTTTSLSNSGNAYIMGGSFTGKVKNSNTLDIINHTNNGSTIITSTINGDVDNSGSNAELTTKCGVINGIIHNKNDACFTMSGRESVKQYDLTLKTSGHGGIEKTEDSYTISKIYATVKGINNSSNNSNSTITNGIVTTSGIVNTGKLASCKVQSSNGEYGLCNTGSIADGAITGTYTGSTCAICQNASGTLTLNLTATSSTGNSVGVKKGTVKITGGTYKGGAGKSAVYADAGAKLTITGGTITRYDANHLPTNGVMANAGSTVSVSGATIKDINGDGIENKTTNTSITDVTISNCNTGINNVANATIITVSGNITALGNGINNTGIITQTSGTIFGGTWGLYNSGIYTQNGGKIFGSSTNSSGKNGGVFQNGTFNISGTAQVASGDVYLCSGKMINVSGELTGTSKVATIDSADKDAGKVLVTLTYKDSNPQDTCTSLYTNKLFTLSDNLRKAKTSSADTSEVEATYSSANTYHDAVLRAGQGLQNTTSETNNPEIMNKEFSNGAEGTLVLSCYLDVTYDLSKVEEITGLRARTYAANGIVDNNYNRNIWKEGFTTSDSEFNNYSNNNDYEVKLSSLNIELDMTRGSSNSLSDIISEVNDGADIIDLLVAGKTYSSGNSKATEGADSYTFLGWCLQEDGSGYIYSSPTSFPIGNNYKWYPIFDVAYSVEYNSNYVTPNRSDLGGEMHYDSYDNGSSVERTTLTIAAKDMTSIAEDTFFKVSSKDETTHLYATSEVLGNCGPNSDIPNYWDKEIETTHKNIYTELDEDYTYWYKFIGWSLNQNSNFTDVFSSDYTKKVYTTSDVENFISPKSSYVENNSIVNNADRLSRLKFLENHSDFIKVKEVDNQSLLYVTMYAIWDEYPEIFAKDFTLMSNDAALTNADTFKQAVIDNYITATDYELNYKSDEHLIVTVENLDYDAIKSIGHGGDDIGTVSVTVKVVDEVGNASYDTCDVTIISSTGMTSPSDGKNASLYVRFVDEENWLKNDFWNIIFANGTKSIKDFGDTESQQIAKMEQICDAYELWLSQTGLSLEVEEILEGTISVEAMNALRDLGTSKSNIQRTMENNSNDGAMDPYSKWYLNPQLVLELNESFDGIVSNPQ